MGSLVELTLLACVECFHWAMVSHNSSVYSAFRSFLLMLSKYLSVRLNTVVILHSRSDYTP